MPAREVHGAAAVIVDAHALPGAQARRAALALFRLVVSAPTCEVILWHALFRKGGWPANAHRKTRGDIVEQNTEVKIGRVEDSRAHLVRVLLLRHHEALAQHRHELSLRATKESKSYTPGDPNIPRNRVPNLGPIVVVEHLLELRDRPLLGPDLQVKLLLLQGRSDRGGGVREIDAVLCLCGAVRC